MEKPKIITTGLIALFVVALSAATISHGYDETVYQAQKELKELGYNPGPFAGIWGKRTKIGIEAFQPNHGLLVSGELDKKTIHKLGLEEPREKEKSDQSENPKLRVEDEILIYLGYKSGSSQIVKLCGLDLKGRAGLPACVFLEAGTGFADAFGPNKYITILGKAGESALVSCKNGTTVEYVNGLVLTMKDGMWIDNCTGKEYAQGYMDIIKIR